MKVYPRHPVEAFQLTWDNWKELADRYRGRFTQGLSIQKSTGTPFGGRAYLSIPDPQTDGYLRVSMGMWVVEFYGGEYKVLTSAEMDVLFRPANEVES